MKKLLYILLILSLFISCEEEDYVSGYVVTKDVTNIVGSTAIAHGDVRIDNIGKGKDLTIWGKGIIYSLDESALHIVSHKYYNEGIYDYSHGLHRYFSYIPTSNAKVEDFGYFQYDGWGDFRNIGGEGEYDCYLSGLKYDATYYVRAFAHITNGIDDTETPNYVYGEIKKFVSGSDTKNPDSYVPLSSLGIAVLKEDLNGLQDAMRFYGYYLSGYFTFGGYNDWRLPTLNELKEIYKMKEEIGGFKTEKYWSSNYYDDIYYYYVDFANSGNVGSMNSLKGAYVRLVRSLP